MNVIEEVRKFVEGECKKDSANYDMDAFNHHFVPMVKYAKILSDKLEADKEVVEIAAWLHDIGSIVVGRKDHHITGQEITEKKLKELGYDEGKIERVKQCIFSHRGSQGIKPKTKEAQIIADADGLAHFDAIFPLVISGVVYHNQSWKESIMKTKQKSINSYNKLSPEAKELVKDKYEAAMLLLKDAD